MIEIARHASALGTIRVMERRSDGARLYCLDQSLQTMTQRDGTSLFGYVHAIKLLLRDAKNVLIIGGGGGSLATMLARRSHDVTVVDVDPAAELLARNYFALDPRVTWINCDAFAFVDACTVKFDAVVIDACDRDGLIDAFSTPANLLAMMKVLRVGGSLIVNLTYDEAAGDWSWKLARSVASLDLNATLFSPADGWEGNELLCVSTQPSAATLNVSDLSDRPAEVRTYLMSLRPYAAASAGGVTAPLSDER